MLVGGRCTITRGLKSNLLSEKASDHRPMVAGHVALKNRESPIKKVPHPENQVRYFHMISFVVLYHADGEALTLQLLDSLTNGFVVLGGYA